MSYLDSNSTWFCDVCGAMVWHDRVELHKGWHSKDSLLVDLERWFHRLGSDDPKWWAKEIHAYLVNGDPLVSDGGEDRP